MESYITTMRITPSLAMVWQDQSSGDSVPAVRHVLNGNLLLNRAVVRERAHTLHDPFVDDSQRIEWHAD